MLPHNRKHSRRGYTIAELMVLMAVVAIGVAVVVKIRDSFLPQFVQTVSVTSDGRRVLTALNDGSILSWDIATGQETSLLGPSDDFVVHSTISPDGTLAAESSFSKSASAGPTLRVADLQTGKVIDRGALGRSLGNPQLMAFSNDGKRLALVDGAANQLRIINPKDPSVADIVLSPLDPTLAGGGTVGFVCTHMAFSPDGQHVLLLSNSGQLLDWNIESGQTSRGSVNSNGSVGLQFTVSPDGNQIAVLSVDPTGNSQQYVVNLYDRHFTPLKQFPVGDMARSIAFCSSGKSLAVLEDDLEILDLGSGATPRRNIPLSDYASMLAASADATQLALSDGLTVYVLDGNQSRKLGGIGSAGGSLFYLIPAFVVVFGLWRMMRKRRTMKTCVDCGKKWQEVKRRPATRLVQCPDCRLEYLPTAELRKRLGNQTRRGLQVCIGVLVFLAALSTWGNGLDDRSAWEIAWLAVRSLLGWAAVFVVLFALILVVVVVWRRAALRRFGKSGHALRSAQTAAASEGSSEQIGTMAVWTDLPLQNPFPLREGAKHTRLAKEGVFSIPSAEELAEQLDDCRRQLEELLGAPCPPMPASQMFIFATTAAAQKFMPVRGLTHEMPAVFCGPWANVGCISIEGLSKQLRPLLPSIRSLMSYQSAPWPRYGFWLGYALHNHVARAIDQAAIDACRRRIAVWAAEGSLLPLAEICRRHIVSVATSGAKSSLPENYNRSLRITNQWLSLADYFCGTDATPERREQFRRLWQAAARVRKLSVALEEACGCSLAELDAQWKTWAATASFGPPTVPPMEIVEVARNEIIPLVRNTATPIQRRIKAIRILGNCGWTIGAEALLEMFARPQPDLPREALAALRLLSGRLGTERPDDWQSWLTSLPTDAEASAWPMSPEDKFGLKAAT